MTSVLAAGVLLKVALCDKLREWLRASIHIVNARATRATLYHPHRRTLHPA